MDIFTMGSKKLYKIGFVILLPDELANKVKDFQINVAKKYDCINSILNPPHITIKRPIEVENIEKYENILDKITNSTKSFKIGIKGYDFFSDKIFFQDVIQSKELINLHNSLLSALKKENIFPDEMEGDNQRFHSTLANGDISAKFLGFLKKNYISKKPSDTFPLKELAILRHTGTYWTIHKISRF
jgi:2'-5' RNA ligase